MFSYALERPSVADTMRTVGLALLPGTIVMTGYLGLGVLLNIATAVVFALLAETLMLYWRRVEIKPFVCDGSAAIAAWLLALALPPYLPWWIPAVAAVAAIVIGKQIYGGLGNNVFNPAMVGYALILIAFPSYMTVWPGLDLLAQRFEMTALSYAFAGEHPMDMMSGATALEVWRASEISYDDNAVLDWRWINLAFLGGGIWLLLRRVILWQIPVAMLVALAVGALMLDGFELAAPVGVFGATFHLLSGATMIGAFFIATDPVTAPQSKAAMLVFGAGVGLLLLIFRLNSVFIDGLAFSILLMNIAVPLLDRYFGSVSMNKAR